MSEFISILERIRPGYDKGGMVKLVEYAKGLPKNTVFTRKMAQDFLKKNKLEANVENFFNRKAPNIKGLKVDTSFQYSDTAKKNIEKFGKSKYDKLSAEKKYSVRKGVDVGKLAPEKQQKVKFKKEYDKGVKYYKSKGVEPNMDSIRKNVALNKGKFKPMGVKLRGEAGLTGILKNYERADLIKDLKKGKTVGEISIDYFDKNKKQVLKSLEGKREYSRPLGRIGTDIGNVIAKDKEALKLYTKMKKANAFNKPKGAQKYVKDLETLLPFAQEKGLVPKVNSKGVKIDTASKYFQHAYKTKSEPISKLFGYFEKVGIEHPGGVTRAVIFNDPATLNEIVATMPDTNVLSGSTYDKYATGQAQFYKRTGDSKYIKSLNKIINQKAKEFGKPRTILDVKKGKVVRRPTKFSLTNPNTFVDAKSFINEYIVAGGSGRKNFNKLDPTLQESIKQYEKGNKVKGNQKLRQALSKILGVGKAVARPVVRAVAPIVPVVGPAITALGVADVAEAAQRGAKGPVESPIAYYFGPDAAEGLMNLKARARRGELPDLADETDFTSFRNGGIVAVKGVI